MEQQPSPLQYSGGHVALWHWASTQPSWSGGPLNAILADRRHANLFDSLWFFQVRVYHQPEGPAVVSPRRAPMLFARADEIIEKRRYLLRRELARMAHCSGNPCP